MLWVTCNVPLEAICVLCGIFDVYMKAKDEIQVGKNNIFYVDSDFTKYFGDGEISPEIQPNSLELKGRILEKNTTDSEILKWAPTLRLTDLWYALNHYQGMLKDSRFNILYIVDSYGEEGGGRVWAVNVRYTENGWTIFVWPAHQSRIVKWLLPSNKKGSQVIYK